MAQAVKVFEVEVDDEAPLPPKPFNIAFKRKSGGETVVHEFHAHGEAPVGLLLALHRTLRYDKHDRARLDLGGLVKFLQVAMPEADFDRLTDLLEDSGLLVPMATLQDVYQWLTEEYYERPTQRSSTSSDGRPTTDTSSTASQSSEG